MSWNRALIRQKEYPVRPQKLCSIWRISQHFWPCRWILKSFVYLSKVKKVKLSSKYLNIFVRFLRIFEYIRDQKIWYSYSNIRYSAENIEYSKIFEYSSRTDVVLLGNLFTNMSPIFRCTKSWNNLIVFAKLSPSPSSSSTGLRWFYFQHQTVRPSPDLGHLK